jgi:type IV pilus assembly protein PilE
MNGGATDFMKTCLVGDYASGRMMRLTRAMGFTLIELMIVVAIIAILSAIAYPSYITYITKSRRVAAEGCLSQYSNYMERYYTSNLRYDQDGSSVSNVLPSLDCASPQQTGNYYGYSFSTTTTQSTYTIQAVPKPPQSTRDITCATLTLNQAGTRTANGSTNVTGCW